MHPDALANTIFGKVNPSGKITETYPIHLEDCLPHQSERSYPGLPTEDGHLLVEYTEGRLVGYRYFNTNNVPVAFPFGYGLSYSTFHYDNVSTTQGPDHTINVHVTLSNTSDVPGKEIIQLYNLYDEPKEGYPAQELSAFTKVMLAPHETQTIVLNIPQMKGKIGVGGNSRSLLEVLIEG